MEISDSNRRISRVLSEALAKLCRNIMAFNSEITVEGLLGITVDKKNVVLVNILEQVPGPSLGQALPDHKEQDIAAENAALIDRYINDSKETDPFANWNPDMDIKIPENILAEFLGKDHLVKELKEDLFDESRETKHSSKSKHHKKKKKEKSAKDGNKHGKAKLNMNTGGSCATEAMVNGASCNKQDEKPNDTDLESVEESERGKALSQSLRYLGERDTLLPMDDEDHILDDFPSSLNSHPDLDSQLNLSLSPLSKNVNDIYSKHSDAFLSPVKEETNKTEQCPLMINTELNSSFMDCDPDDLESTGDKYPCDLCGILFSHKRSLWRHQKKHKSDQTWPCNICSEKFSRKDILLRHQKHHHTKSEQCPFCTKTLSRHDSMQRHILVSHSKVVH